VVDKVNQQVADRANREAGRRRAADGDRVDRHRRHKGRATHKRRQPPGVMPMPHGAPQNSLNKHPVKLPAETAVADRVRTVRTERTEWVDRMVKGAWEEAKAWREDPATVRAAMAGEFS